jgi:hypothetical protein
MLHSMLAKWDPAKFRSKEYFQGIVTGFEQSVFHKNDLLPVDFDIWDAARSYDSAQAA